MICLYKTAGSVLVVRGIGAVANGNTARATLRNVTPCQAFHATCRRGPYGGNIGGIRSLKNAIRTTLLRPSVMWLTSDKPLRCKGLQRIAKYGNMISRGVGNIWQSFQIGGYECIKREYVTPIKRGAIAVFVDVGSSSSRWFRRREGRSRVFCFPTKLRDGSSFSPFEPCRPTSPFADRDTITPRMAEFQRFRNSYCGTPR